MFTETELNYLKDALAMAFQSNKRAQNTRTNPQFQAIHAQIATDLHNLTAKIGAMKPLEAKK